MILLGAEKIHYIEKVLLYTPLMAGVFIALSVWGEGLAFGFMGVGVILTAVLLDGMKKIAGNNGRFVPPIYSILLTAIIVYYLVIGSIYQGIFYLLIGTSMVFDRFLKGRWRHICFAIAIGLAMVIFILYLKSD